MLNCENNRLQSKLDLNAYFQNCNVYIIEFLRATACNAIARMLSQLWSVRRVYHRKTVKVTIMKFSPYGSPIALVFAG